MRLTKTRTARSTGRRLPVCGTCLVHDYFDVDFEAVWDVITRDLPPLEFVMRSILARMDPKS